jgi:hypothetical protein
LFLRVTGARDRYDQLRHSILPQRVGKITLWEGRGAGAHEPGLERDPSAQ